MGGSRITVKYKHGGVLNTELQINNGIQNLDQDQYIGMGISGGGYAPKRVALNCDRVA